MRLTVYTDGACSPNPGRGGWAWATSISRFNSGCVAQATNQQMELMAALRAREALTGPLEIVSDSKYVVDCLVLGWYKTWQSNGWRASNGKVKNRELWEALLQLVQLQPTEFRWIKGHAGHPIHTFVDGLAVEARKDGRE